MSNFEMIEIFINEVFHHSKKKGTTRIYAAYISYYGFYLIPNDC